jgi:hypothetical protein
MSGPLWLVVAMATTNMIAFAIAVSLVNLPSLQSSGRRRRCAGAWRMLEHNVEASVLPTYWEGCAWTTSRSDLGELGMQAQGVFSPIN